MSQRYVDALREQFKLTFMPESDRERALMSLLEEAREKVMLLEEAIKEIKQLKEII
jgi:hypothetical protein